MSIEFLFLLTRSWSFTLTFFTWNSIQNAGKCQNVSQEISFANICSTVHLLKFDLRGRENVLEVINGGLNIFVIMNWHNNQTAGKCQDVSQ